MKNEIKRFFKKILVSVFSTYISTKKIIIFESNPDFADNTYWLFKYIVENKYFPNYKFVWFVTKYNKKKDTLCGAPIICVDQFKNRILKIIRRFYYLYSAKIIFDCNRCIHKVKDEQIRVYITHGMGIKIPKEYIKSIGDCTALTVIGESFISQFSPYVNGNILPLGLPRNEILAKHYVKTDEHKIVWMPTYRQHKAAKENGIINVFPLGIPVLKSEEDIEKIDTYLFKNNCKLYIRLHPAQDTSIFKLKATDRIILADDDFLRGIGKELYRFLSETDALITDYSSVYYDYLLTNKPIGLTLEDAELMASKWGLWFDDIRNELPGFKIDTYNDLINFIQSVIDGQDEYLKEREDFCNRFDVVNRDASKSIVEYCLKELEKQ